MLRKYMVRRMYWSTWFWDRRHERVHFCVLVSKKSMSRLKIFILEDLKRSRRDLFKSSGINLFHLGIIT